MKKLLLVLSALCLCGCKNNDNVDLKQRVFKTETTVNDLIVARDELYEIEDKYEKVKTSFSNWLSEQDFESDPYTIITYKITLTESTAFDYKYYVADVYYTTGEMHHKQFLFAYSDQIVQIVEIKL